MPSEISVPFRVDQTGRVVVTTDPDAQVRLHVLALLNTVPAERAMVPGYGTEITSLMFTDVEADEVATQAGLLVKEAVTTWEPGVELVAVAPDVVDSDGNVSVLDVTYRRLDAADAGDVANANVAIIGAAGVVREVVKG